MYLPVVASKYFKYYHVIRFMVAGSGRPLDGLASSLGIFRGPSPKTSASLAGSTPTWSFLHYSKHIVQFSAV